MEAQSTQDSLCGHSVEDETIVSSPVPTLRGQSPTTTFRRRITVADYSDSASINVKSSQRGDGN
jgi:hypothetical protein